MALSRNHPCVLISRQLDSGSFFQLTDDGAGKFAFLSI